MKVLLSLIFLSLSTFAGTEMGNGGDAVLQEFNLRGIQIGLYLRENPKLAETHKVDPEKFLSLVKLVSLEVEDQLILNGVEVDAINYPQSGKIVVSRARWKADASQSNAFLIQRRIALHEYLWMYGIDDSNYVVSNPIISDLEGKIGAAADPDVRKFLQAKVCDAIDKLDLQKIKYLLNWGLDLNERCLSYDRWITPAEVLIFANMPDSKYVPVRREIARELFTKGMNPNSEIQDWGVTTILYHLMRRDFELGKMALQFGADPNAQVGSSSAQTVSSLIAEYDWEVSSSNPWRMDVKTFRALIDAGSDLNKFFPYFELAKSMARVIVGQQNNAKVVEELIVCGKVDWCTVTQPTMRGLERTIDSVQSEYKPLLKKYNISCP